MAQETTFSEHFVWASGPLASLKVVNHAPLFVGLLGGDSLSLHRPAAVTKL